jgi:hypothetical protein
MNLETWQIVRDLTEEYGAPKANSDKGSLLFKKNRFAPGLESNLKEVATFEACVVFDCDGMLSTISYWMNDRRHRPCEEGPAFISYRRNSGMGLRHEYYEYGRLTRTIYPKGDP